MAPAKTSLVVPSGQLIVVTMDQRASRSRDDAVDAEREQLNRTHRAALKRRFVRTAGDEMQGVSERLDWLPGFLLTEARREVWWVGVGLGPYEAPLGQTARDSRGDAFYLARDAVERAKRRSWGFAMAGDPVLEDVERCLATVAWIIRRRTERQHEAAILYHKARSVTAVAEALGITVQSASERLLAAGVAEEAAGLELALTLLAGVSG